MKKQWETLSAAEKSQYESEASALYDKYQREFGETNMLSDQLWTKMQRIKARGDLETRTQVKRVSPYRIYKRETAAQIKSEYPAMSNEERSQIVKERWHTISDRLKAVYVALARLEEEKLAWDAIQDFYKERINTMRDHAGMQPVTWPLWNHPGNISGKKETRIDDKSLANKLSYIDPKNVKTKQKDQKESGKSTTPSGSEG